MQWVNVEFWSSSSWLSCVHHKHSNPLYCNLTPCCVNIYTEISVTVHFRITYENRRNFTWFGVPELKFYFTRQRNSCRSPAAHFRLERSESDVTNHPPVTADPHSMECAYVSTSAFPNNKLRCQVYSLSTSLVAISYIQSIITTGFLYNSKPLNFALYCAVWSYRNTERDKPVFCIILLGRRILHGEGWYIIMIWRICGRDLNSQVIGKLLL
jgi:hypothetical protein